MTGSNPQTRESLQQALLEENLKDPVYKIGFIMGAGYQAISSTDEGKLIQEKLGITEEIRVDTPYGSPSDSYQKGKISTSEGEIEFILLPRHGRKYTIPPHKINHKANIWGFHFLGVQQIVSFAPAWSFGESSDDFQHILNHLFKNKPKQKMAIGDIALITDFMDLSSKTHPTFFDGPTINHISCSNPKAFQSLLFRTVRNTVHQFKNEQSLNFNIHGGGKEEVILRHTSGPNFPSPPEARAFKILGADIANMTQYYEYYLARECEIEIACLAVIAGESYDMNFKRLHFDRSMRDITSVHKFQKRTMNLLKAITQKHVSDRKNIKFKSVWNGKIINNAQD
jgi:5'-methylthioadenosine phosphorylase